MDEADEPFAAPRSQHFLGCGVEAKPARDPARGVAKGEGRVAEVEADVAGREQLLELGRLGIGLGRENDADGERRRQELSALELEALFIELAQASR